jgi:hypothetical protein
MQVRVRDAKAGPVPLQTPSDLKPNAVRDLSGALNILLADMFTLYLKTKNFHWHMARSRRDALSAGLQCRRAILNRRSPCGAGRWRDQRHRDRSFAVGDAAVRDPQERRQDDAMAARGRCRELLHHGDGSQSRRCHAGSCPRDAGVPAAAFRHVPGRRLFARQHRGRLSGKNFHLRH